MSRDWKYIWNPITGHEQLFDRQEDPGELHDLAQQDGCRGELKLWRGRLAAELKGRPEGLSDGRELRCGTVPVWRDPRD